MNIKMEILNLVSQNDVNLIRKGFEKKEGILGLEIILEDQVVNVMYDDFYITQYVVIDIMEELGYTITNISGKMK